MGQGKSFSKLLVPDLRSCTGGESVTWNIAKADSEPTVAARQMDPSRVVDLIHHPLHQEENDDSGSCQPWSWSSVDNDGKRFKEAGPDWLGGWKVSQVGCCCCTLLKILEPRRLIVHRKSIYLAKYTYIHIFCINLNTGTRMMIGQNKVNIKN